MDSRRSRRFALFVAAVVMPIATQALAGGWVARHGMTSQSYQQAFDSYGAQGYRLVDIGAYSVDGEPRFAAVWWQESPTSPRAWVAHHALSAVQFQRKLDRYREQGYRLVDVSGYAHAGKARYAAIWQQRGGSAQVARHGMTPARFRETVDDLAAQGFRLTNVSGFTVARQVRFAAAWTRDGGTRWQVRHGLTGAQYQRTFDRMVRRGLRLADVSVYRVNGRARYAAVWVEAGGMTWQARHGQTSTQHQSSFGQLAAEGYRLVNVSAAGLPGGARYASIWWKL